MLDIRRGENGEIVLSGRFDASQAEQAERFLEAATGQVVLDFKDLQYISSLGLGTLVKTQKRLQAAGGGIRLVNVSPHIRDIFQFSGLHFLFPIDAPPSK
jgi:anti-anti-sigma factor